MGSLVTLISLLALYTGGIPTREPPSCEAPQEPTIYHSFFRMLKAPPLIPGAYISRYHNAIFGYQI